MALYTPTQITNVRDSAVTFQAGGVATAPTAGTAIATVTVNTPGLYEVQVWFANGAGTAVVGDVGNMNLKQNTTTKIAALAGPLTGLGAPVTIITNCAVGDTLSVTAVANATSGVAYAATIVARQLAQSSPTT